MQSYQQLSFFSFIFQGNNTILQTAVKYFSTYHDICNGHQGGDNPDKLPHFITSNLEHDSVKLVLEHLAEEGIASKDLNHILGVI